MKRWNIIYKQTLNGSIKTLCDEDDKVIADIEILNDVFIQILIEKHNHDVSSAYSRGLFDGAKIAEQVLTDKK